MAGALAPPARGGDSFYCGSRVVTTGLSDAEVRAACGEPDELSRERILRRPTVWRQGRPIVVGSEEVEVPVERWRYDFGPNRLKVALRVEDGVLAEIRSLGYGHAR